MRVLLVDDEAPARRKLRLLLGAHPDATVAGEASSGEEALALLQRTEVDLVFLDVQMPDMDGFEVLRRLGGPATFLPVFITAFDEFAVRAFEVQALDYLLKPVDARRFATMMTRARAAIGATGAEKGAQGARRLLVTDKDRSYFVATDSVDWVEADRNYVVLHAGGIEHVVRGTLEAFARALGDDRFVRISRSHVVRRGAVRELRQRAHGERSVVLSDGAVLTWTRRYKPEP